jgi:U3 small nucleolar RNA-associated protein 15
MPSILGGVAQLVADARHCVTLYIVSVAHGYTKNSCLYHATDKMCFLFCPSNFFDAQLQKLRQNCSFPLQLPDMAAEVTSLPQIRLPSTAAQPTPDQRYWASFSSQQLIPTTNSSPVTYVSTNSPALPTSHVSATPPTAYIAITTGPRIQLFSPHSLKPVRTIARTSSPFHSAHVRTDGRVVLAGSDSGVIQAFDTSSRAILKTWNEHKQPVWVTKWHPRDPTASMSCSDDATVRLWDLPSDESTWTGWGHEDYVRSGAYVGDAHLLVTGSYDRSIRVWDTRIGSGPSGSRACAMNFKLASPVEVVMPLLNGTTIVGAAGEKLAVLDLIAAKPLQLLHNHQKTITALSLATHGDRILTGSLDGHVKAFSTSSWTVLSGYKYPSPVLSLAVVSAGPNRDDRHVCVGLQSGLLSIRTRLPSALKAAKREREKEMDAMITGTTETFDAKRSKKERKQKLTKGWATRLRGRDYIGEAEDIIINPLGASGALRRSGKSPWENALRKGEYAKSLALVLATKDRAAILTLLSALIHRNALRTALAPSNSAAVLLLIRWLQRNVSDPRCTRLVSNVCETLVEEVAEHVGGTSPELDESIERLHEEVRMCAEMAQMAVSTVGMLELLQAGTG